MVVVLSGPSGVGKDTILDAVYDQDPGLRKIVTATTRQPRAGEQDGLSYHFLSTDEFRHRIDEGYFLEWAPVHDQYYGTPVKSVSQLCDSGLDVLLKIDVQGCQSIRQLIPDSVSIFLAPPSMDELYRRLAARSSESPASLEIRQQNALIEISAMPNYQYVVVNSVVEQAVQDVLAIVRAERMRTSRLL
jgi:guanylate kinase